ncbi:Aldo/keto reductase [Gloeophyllum trabeum ATCC 11539]|uniref:Aldo/keto reductase n=1 Tax=Gloeophyllum trabeum (strain ATCC 11539 / FP-39264 / Madison 617) TaxID=670483 RepID=S7RJ64_GLOTA|nr:Aldo/keto reductase [Gloeophyllum trabeum ATCC 11539]EPQ52664.1 Aldo/keto reductase [Gloeophyllum trabeum ATCC 11539]
MVSLTAKLGGTASQITVGKIGHGLMNMTWKEVPTPDEECFEAIKAGVDSLPEGARMLLNSGEFYGPNYGTANLELLSRFYEKYPDYADKTFLSVKGGIRPDKSGLKGSLEALRASVDNINNTLRGKKKLDLFEMARVDKNMPIEEAVKNMAILVKEGLFDHIGMSECKAETLRRGNSVHPITAVEIEVSPWSYEDETKKVIATAQELNITVAAYSPVGRGFLTGQIKSLDDVPQGDPRRHLARFQPENFQHNLALLHDWMAYAEQKQRVLENLASVNVNLSEQDMADIGKIITSHEIKGGRYRDGDEEIQNLWG